MDLGDDWGFPHDADRNRVIEAKDRVAGDNLTWRLPLDVAMVEGAATKLVPRSVLFRLGRATGTLSYATRGYLEGKTALGADVVAVRRMDGDGNGFFTDSQDRLWIDLNRDGRWDPVDEQFLFAPILQFGTQRYAVRSDPLGTWLTFSRLEGTGTVQLKLSRPELADLLLELTATLQGKDGSAFGLRGKDGQAVLPIGEYRLSALTLTLRDPQGGLPWSFVFSDNGGREPHVWHRVMKDALLSLDPIGRLEMTADLDAAQGCKPGQDLYVRPRLYTGGGLLINTAYRGAAGPFGGGCSGQITLVAADGQVLARGSSGFA